MTNEEYKLISESLNTLKQNIEEAVNNHTDYMVELFKQNTLKENQ